MTVKVVSLVKYSHFPKKWTSLDIFEVLFKALQVFSIHKQQPSTGALLNSFSGNFEKKNLKEKIQAGDFPEKIQLKPLSPNF